MINSAKTSNSKISIFPHLGDDKSKIALDNFFKLKGLISSNYEAFMDPKSPKPLNIITDAGEQIQIVGLENVKTPAAVSKALRSVFSNGKFKAEVAVYVEHCVEAVPAMASGIELSAYKLGMLKTNKEDKKIDNAVVFVSDTDLTKAVFRGVALAQTQAKIMHWMDLPANHKTPSMVASWMQQGAKELGIDINIYDAEQCKTIGLEALLAVGKGSVESPACFVILEYKHAAAKESVGLIGKGVTFDTGGVSLKPGENMNYMKSDMGGAAAVYGTIEMAAKLKLPVHLVAAIPLTENCIDSLAVKPGDVIGSYLGKTIEVINTDAEGRLILADALAYINKNHKPDVMIDLATLTGNCIAALGYAAAAMCTNNEELADSIYKAGQKTGEKVWRMPLWDDYKDMMKSDVADIKNLSSAPVAGAITAAKFLEEFTENHTAWAHLDIAGTAFGDSEFGSMKSASGYGVALLIDWLESRAK